MSISLPKISQKAKTHARKSWITSGLCKIYQTRSQMYKQNIFETITKDI